MRSLRMQRRVSNSAIYEWIMMIFIQSDALRFCISAFVANCQSKNCWGLSHQYQISNNNIESMPQQDLIQTWLTFDTYLKNAIEFLKAHAYSEAAFHLVLALRIINTHATAYYLLGIAHKRMGNRPKGLSLQKHAITLNEGQCELYKVTHQSEADQIIFDDETIEQIKQRYEATHRKQQQIRANPSDGKRSTLSSFQDMADPYIRIGDFCTARLIMSAAFQFFRLNKSDDQLHGNRDYTIIGMTYYQLGESVKGSQILAFMIDIAKQQYVYFNNLSILIYIMGDYQLCNKYISRSLEINSNYPRSCYIFSFLTMKLGRIEESLQAINVSIAARNRTVFYYFKKLCIMALHCQLGGQFVECLKQSRKIMIEGKNDDPNLLKPKFVPFAKRFINLMWQIYEQLGQAGIKDQLFQEYLQVFDDFLIVGSFQKYKIQRSLIKKQKIIRTVRGIVEKPEPPPQQQAEQQAEDMDMGGLFD